MDLAYRRFGSDVIKIIEDISESHFVAFDLEFSGISGPSQRRTPGKPSLQEIYEESRVAATKFQILQVGLTIVREDLENNQYVAKPYNFNISPVPTLRERHFTREWSMSSGAVQFLLKNRFDFGIPFVDGIPYLSRAEEVQARMNLSGENDKKRPDMILKPEDENLVKHIRNSIAHWQEIPEEDRENYLNIPNDDRGKGVPGALNRYQVRLTHQIVQNEFPDFKATSMQNFVQISNPAPEERERQRVLQQEHIDREIGRAVGFRWILEAIAGRDISGMPDEYFLPAISHFKQSGSELNPFQEYVTSLNQRLRRRRRVLIGHNCFTDLIYLHQFFLGELPDRVQDFQESVNELFPAVVDTKNIASFGNGRWGDTSLTAVEEDLREEPEPTIVVPGDFDRYVSNEKPHEAGYDALLTAKIAIKLSAKMEREGTYLNEEGSKNDSHLQASARMELFGTKEEGYVTASEDLDNQSSRATNSKDNKLLEGEHPQHHKESKDSKMQSKPSKHSNETFATDNDNIILENSPSSEVSNVIAVKDVKAQSIPPPANSNSKAEVEKIRSAFAATNIYDVLDHDGADNKDGADDLMSFSDPDSPSSKRAHEHYDQEQTNVDDMVQQGRLMPRWDGGNGFWRIFGNKLQVNSSKEGVCNL